MDTGTFDITRSPLWTGDFRFPRECHSERLVGACAEAPRTAFRARVRAGRRIPR